MQEFGDAVCRGGTRRQANTRTNLNYLSNLSPASKIVPNNGLQVADVAARQQHRPTRLETVPDGSGDAQSPIGVGEAHSLKAPLSLRERGAWGYG